MDVPKIRTAFLCQQRLSLLEQKTHNTPQVTDVRSVIELLLVESAPPAATWKRTIEEFVLSAEQIKSLTGKMPLEREELRRMSSKTLATQPILVHPETPIAIESDRLNKKPVIPVVGDMVPYELSNEPLPLPAFALYWPTVTPTFPEERRNPGSAWKGSLNVRCGAGIFPLSYMVELKEYVSDDPVVQITLDQQAPTSKAGKVTLALRPQGTWVACISHIDSVCQWAKGQWSASVRATVKTADEDIDVEVLRWRNEFNLERTALPFDEKKVFPMAWRPNLNVEPAVGR
jgi:hypothetical protein